MFSESLVLKLFAEGEPEVIDASAFFLAEAVSHHLRMGNRLLEDVSAVVGKHCRFHAHEPVDRAFFTPFGKNIGDPHEEIVPPALHRRRVALAVDALWDVTQGIDGVVWRGAELRTNGDGVRLFVSEDSVPQIDPKGEKAPEPTWKAVDPACDRCTAVRRGEGGE